MMRAPAFDTHAYVKRLQCVGFSETQAEVQVELQTETFSMLITETLATKDDLTKVRIALKNDIVELRTELKSDIVELRTELKSDIAELSSTVAQLDIKFTEKFNSIHWMFKILASSNIAIISGIVGMAFKMFAHG